MYRYISNMKNIGYCKYPFGLVLKLFEILEKAVGRIPREMVSFEESRFAFLFFLNICPFWAMRCAEGEVSFYYSVLLVLFGA